VAVIEDLIRSRDNKPQAIALSTPDGQTLSWEELYRAGNRVANALSDHGSQSGDKVAILAPNSLEYVEVFVGALQAGACVVPLPTGIAHAGLRLMLDECEPTAIFVHADYEDFIANWFGRITKNRRPRIIFLGGERNDFLDFSEFKATASEGPPAVRIEPEMWFNIIYSSGTTGRPKGIVHTHGCRQAHIETVKLLGATDVGSIGPDSILLLSTALHSNATISPLITGLAVGAETIIMRSFDTMEFLKLCESRRPTHVIVVPVQIRRVLDHPEFDSIDLGDQTVKITSSAKLPAAAKLELIDRWPGGLIDGYGQTEGAPVTCWLSSEDMEKPESVGRPIAGGEIRIIDDNDKPLLVGQKGEVVGRSATMMWGYFNSPELTESKKWRDEENREFIRSGDIGMIDDDNYLYILDRSKDVIISGGFNIYASDLEAVIMEHPDVADVTVIGVSSQRWGETPLAIVVPKMKSEIDRVELLAWVNKRLGKIQKISQLAFRDEIPRNDVGKVLKRDLRSQYSAPDQTGY